MARRTSCALLVTLVLLAACQPANPGRTASDVITPAASQAESPAQATLPAAPGRALVPASDATPTALPLATVATTIASSPTPSPRVTATPPANATSTSPVVVA